MEGNSALNDLTLEAQGLAALGAWRKILKSFEVVRRKMGIGDLTAPAPPPPRLVRPRRRRLRPWAQLVAVVAVGYPQRG